MNTENNHVSALVRTNIHDAKSDCVIGDIIRDVKGPEVRYSRGTLAMKVQAFRTFLVSGQCFWTKYPSRLIESPSEICTSQQSTTMTIFHLVLVRAKHDADQEALRKVRRGH